MNTDIITARQEIDLQFSQLLCCLDVSSSPYILANHLQRALPSLARTLLYYHGVQEYWKRIQYEQISHKSKLEAEIGLAKSISLS